MKQKKQTALELEEKRAAVVTLASEARTRPQKAHDAAEKDEAAGE